MNKAQVLLSGGLDTLLCTNLVPTVIKKRQAPSRKRKARIFSEESEHKQNLVQDRGRKRVEEFVPVQIPEKKKVRRQTLMPAFQQQQQIQIHIDKTEDRDCLVKLYMRINELQEQIAKQEKVLGQLEVDHAKCGSMKASPEVEERVEEELVYVEVEHVRHVPVEKVVTVEVVRVVEGPPQVRQRVVQVKKVIEQEQVISIPVEKVVLKKKYVEVPVQKLVTRERVVEVPVEKVVYKERRVEVPRVVRIQRPYDVPYQVPVPVDVEVPYEVRVPVEVEVPVPFQVDVPVERHSSLYYGKGYEVPVQEIVDYEREVVVEVPVRVEIPRRVEVPVQVRVPKAREKVVWKEVGLEWQGQLRQEEEENGRLRRRMHQIINHISELVQSNNRVNYELQQLLCLSEGSSGRNSDQSIKNLSNIHLLKTPPDLSAGKYHRDYEFLYGKDSERKDLFSYRQQQFDRESQLAAHKTLEVKHHPVQTHSTHLANLVTPHVELGATQLQSGTYLSNNYYNHGASQLLRTSLHHPAYQQPPQPQPQLQYVQRTQLSQQQRISQQSASLPQPFHLQQVQRTQLPKQYQLSDLHKTNQLFQGQQYSHLHRIDVHQPQLQSQSQQQSFIQRSQFAQPSQISYLPKADYSDPPRSSPTSLQPATRQAYMLRTTEQSMPQRSSQFGLQRPTQQLHTYVQPEAQGYRYSSSGQQNALRMDYFHRPSPIQTAAIGYSGKAQYSAPSIEQPIPTIRVFSPEEPLSQGITWRESARSNYENEWQGQDLRRETDSAGGTMRGRVQSNIKVGQDSFGQDKYSRRQLQQGQRLEGQFSVQRQSQGAWHRTSYMNQGQNLQTGHSWVGQTGGMGLGTAQVTSSALGQRQFTSGIPLQSLGTLGVAGQLGYQFSSRWQQPGLEKEEAGTGFGEAYRFKYQLQPERKRFQGGIAPIVSPVFREERYSLLQEREKGFSEFKSK